MREQCYAVTAVTEIDPIRSELRKRFSNIREVSRDETFEVFDSFDWRLYNKGWLLLKEKGGYALIDRRSGQGRYHLAVDDGRTRSFHWDFPESDLSAALEAVLDMRALLPLGKIHRHRVRYDLLNRDEKTVVRLAMETFSGKRTDAAVRLFRLIPVRGYEKEAQKVAGCLQYAGLGPTDEAFPVLTVLALHDHPPGVYSSKINVSLQPAMRAAEAVRCILGDLVSVIQINLPGLCQDIDIEFLHDFRVAVRRARSLLSQMKGVLDVETTATLQRRLKVLGKATGNVRDLDVYLLKEAEYSGVLPDLLKPGIGYLFGMLKRKRRNARDRMIKAMGGVEIAAALVDLKAFATEGHGPAIIGPQGNLPIGELAKSAIFKRYRRIIQQGGRISDATLDEKLHALRIECKKLRYLLEFFASLFPNDAVQVMIKQLKQLQDNLGGFNDLSVQQAFMRDRLNALRPQTDQLVILAAATGALITHLHTAQRRVRSQSLDAFETFRAPENQERFTTLFDGV
ncbi:MAG: CHAD domain-containing protein [Pseudomonadota bacterium]